MQTQLMTQKNAVKAIIYREDGKILMQQRDYTEGLPFAGIWTFFGGSINNNKEKLKIALKRELNEELKFSPKKIEDKIFSWTWKSDWVQGHNHFYPVKYNGIEELKLKEGVSMKWFSIEDYILNPLTPDVYENFDKIYNFLKLKKLITKNGIKKIEDCIINKGNFIKKNNRVFYTSKKTCDLSRQEIFLLKNLANLRKEKIFRVCMHINDKSKTHEMLMIHVQPVVVGPLRQDTRSLSYHVIEGELYIKIFDKKGKELYGHQLSIHNGSQFLRLEASKFRSVNTLSQYAIFLEITNGPFKDEDTIWFNN
mgnify:CR=1 FL=1|tara:strand:- start:1539 stop:2465 length:927 start_codon:yes stop_codon:yes gene_type:complete